MSKHLFKSDFKRKGECWLLLWEKTHNIREGRCYDYYSGLQRQKEIVNVNSLGLDWGCRLVLAPLRRCQRPAACLRRRRLAGHRSVWEAGGSGEGSEKGLYSSGEGFYTSCRTCGQCWPRRGLCQLHPQLCLPPLPPRAAADGRLERLSERQHSLDVEFCRELKV